MMLLMFCINTFINLLHGIGNIITNVTTDKMPIIAQILLLCSGIQLSNIQLVNLVKMQQMLTSVSGHIEVRSTSH